MAFTSSRPISVDGVRLDTLAWNVEKVNRATAGRRSNDYDVPGLDGSIPSLHDSLEPATYGLEMWLRGTDADGAVPAAGSLTTLRSNLDELLHLFGQRHKLLDLREVVDGSGTERRAWAKVVDTIEPELYPGASGRFRVGFVIPSGCWEDPAPVQSLLTAPVASAEVVEMRGATERIADGRFLLIGPATTPRITDPATGMYVELGQAIASGSRWYFNSATWRSVTGAAVTLANGETTGTDVSGLTTTGGPSRAYGLPLTPVRDTGQRRVRVTLSAASGIVNGTTALYVHAARKYAA